MSADYPARPSWPHRLLCVSGYFGLAPLLLLGPRRSAFQQHHAKQALTVGLLFLLFLLLGAIGLVGLTYLVFQRSASEETVYAVAISGGIVQGLLALLILLLWLAGITLALAGSVRAIPLVGRMARSRFWTGTALVSHLLAWVGVGIAAGLTLHANSLTRESGPAPVYVLVDRLGMEKLIPNWALRLASYRMALAARERFGEGSIVVAPLNERSLREAMRHGRVVMLLCHGYGGDVYMPDGWVTPVAQGPVLHSGPRWLTVYRDAEQGD